METGLIQAGFLYFQPVLCSSSGVRQMVDHLLNFSNSTESQFYA
jgi:hypothetical protein